ncbi:hypothetical protein FB45DRAFT_1104464 [Roridomyces roridus]|uniref:Uncharacterized protein n=1 Tax=Roridomyces roridus TaxID=1738132 RepID=A0AAD7BCW9_9AGAR|nr:hypothetical protein FB45DRAFT_1104464 [Roridomyces roridus]
MFSLFLFRGRTELFLGYADIIAISNIFPGCFDERRLLDALQDTLAYYPHATGRLRIKGNDWSGKRGVPILFETIQEPLDHFQSPSAVPPEIVDEISMDITGADQPDWDEPLMRLKVTYCPKTNESSLGWSSSHMLGDGEFVFQFLCAWSQYYQGKHPFFGRPTYEKFRDPTPAEHNDGNPSTAAFIDRHLPHLKELYPKDKWAEMMGSAFATTTHVDLLFSPQQIIQLRAVANLWPGNAGERTSANDAVAGYVVATLNRCLKTPIKTIGSLLSYRGVKNPDVLKPGEWRVPGLLAVGNPLFFVRTPTLSVHEASSIGALALAIRNSLKDARNYEHVKRVVAVSEPIWMRQSAEGVEHKFWDDNTLLVNTMSRSDFSLQNFGFARDQVRTHCYNDIPGYIRCFKAPPIRQADGTWNANVDALWLFTRVPTEIHERFMAMVAADLNSSEFPENLVTRERNLKEIVASGRARL